MRDGWVITSATGERNHSLSHAKNDSSLQMTSYTRQLTRLNADKGAEGFPPRGYRHTWSNIFRTTDHMSGFKELVEINLEISKPMLVHFLFNIPRGEIHFIYIY